MPLFTMEYLFGIFLAGLALSSFFASGFCAACATHEGQGRDTVSAVAEHEGGTGASSRGCTRGTPIEVQERA